ncbi:MAG TPA: SDR family oxidoreductase [Bacteroidota bacterium]|nr:SDR family oxidoreductase [Bacteroidota bacterium]
MKTVLITGASGGIGYDLAEIFAKHEYNLVLVARNETKLQQIKSDWETKYHIQIDILSKDLSLPSAAKEIYDSIRAKNIFIDVLVNNAGFGWRGYFSEMNETDVLEMIQVNITSLVHLTRLLLPKMIEHKNGIILNVASTAAFQPGPEMAMYYATKAFVLSFSEALSEEVRTSGITVTTLCPGPTDTNFQARANMANTQLFRRMAVMNSSDVAAAGYRALMNGKRVVVPGFMNKLGVWSTRFASHGMIMRMVRFMHKEK